MVESGNRIIVDPNICNGKPSFQGTRIAVSTILDFLASGDSPDDILEQYPAITRQDITSALEFASKMTNNTFTIKSVA